MAIPHHLKLNLFVALDALFHQHFVHRGEVQGISHHILHLLRVVGEAAARSAQREGRTKDYRIAYLFGRCQTFFNAVADFGGNHRLAYAQAQFLEQFPVFGLLDVLEGGAQDFHAALFQHALFG